MAAQTATPRRAPGRPRTRPISTPDTGPPHKRRKYTPAAAQSERAHSFKEGEKAEAAENVDIDIFARENSTITVGDGRVEDDELEPTIALHDDEGQTSPRTVRASTYSRPRRDRERTRTRARPAATPRPRYSSAAAAAAATQASDGYKPREERSWEEFHPDLDIDAELMVFTADEVDGRKKGGPRLSLLRQETTSGDALADDINAAAGASDPAGSALTNGEASVVLHESAPAIITPKRRPGRPPRRPESMLSGLGSPPAPRIMPLPTHNPKERLNLPKPSCRRVDTFKNFEQGEGVQVNYVDKAMAAVGYQENDRFEAPSDILIRHVDTSNDDDGDAGLVLESDDKNATPTANQTLTVEYDMDEQDERWLEAHNAHRKEEQWEAIKPAIFEITMTHIEREYYALEKRIPKPNPRHAQTHRPRSSSAAAVNGEPPGSGDEPDSKCAICDDGDCENANAIIFCDGCDLAVHQECYGVPFIPEGQWFCRKCKEIGRGTPTCIFCPNIDGAFKQTNTLRWSHLLCAIWIPEVTIANPTFMEPIQDVEKVPKSRWGLNCYICNQRMGACIQCGNKACYQAFHVTCARRARLFLRMKSTHAGSIDASVLKAFCDRHVPSDWRRDHDTDLAIAEAKRYYRHTMRDRRWADSQAAALAMGAPPINTVETADEPSHGDDGGTIVVANTKRKKSQPQKTGWRLPSGAPVVPAVVFHAIDAALTRYNLRGKKDFVAEACKYWTLKREARRGAALLKRLQLQLESFSTMEVTRRNFAGMGAAGRPRLLKRIDFAELLTEDIDRLALLVEKVQERELKKMQDAETLKQLIDTVYFPVSDLLWPILEKAQKLDEKLEIFRDGFRNLENKLSTRSYTSVTAFSADIGSVLSTTLSRLDDELHLAANDSQMATQDLLDKSPRVILSHAQKLEQKQQKLLAKRIAKAVKDPLETAMKKEAELKGVPYEKEMEQWANLDSRLNQSISRSRRASVVTLSLTNGDISKPFDGNVSISAIGGASPSPKQSRTGSDAEMQDVVLTEEAAETTPCSKRSSPAKSAMSQPTEPISPPRSASSAVNNDHVPVSTTPADPWSRGGVPWYMRSFDPVGTTVHDERWTGPEQIRAMSEALSEMDEDTLLDVLEQSNAGTEDVKASAPPTKRTRTPRTPRTKARPEPPVQTEDEVEEERLAREKKDKANAKRRASRRAAK